MISGICPFSFKQAKPSNETSYANRNYICKDLHWHSIHLYRTAIIKKDFRTHPLKPFSYKHYGRFLFSGLHVPLLITWTWIPFLSGAMKNPVITPSRNAFRRYDFWCCPIKAPPVIPYRIAWNIYKRKTDFLYPCVWNRQQLHHQRFLFLWKCAVHLTAVNLAAPLQLMLLEKRANRIRYSCICL